jgi:hypothetical protein
MNFAMMYRQMSLNLKVMLLAIPILLSGCHFFSENHEEPVEIRQITDVPLEVKVPSVVWDLLEEKKLINSKANIVANPDIPVRLEENVFTGIKVMLREKTPGVLGGKNFELRSARSGMTLDLAQYIKMEKGTFIISIEPEQPMDSVTAQVLFLSQSVRRASGDQILGGGCNEFYEITQAFLSQFRQGGIEVNVTEGRHISFLAGSFFIRAYNEKGVRALTQLTVTDSNHPELLCGGNGSVSEKD